MIDTNFRLTPGKMIHADGGMISFRDSVVLLSVQIMLMLCLDH